MAAKRKKPAGKTTIGGQLIGLFAVVVAVVFMPTTVMLFFGMIPTAVAAVVDRTRRGTKALTVGSMNLAGCTPYLFELWTKGHTSERALEIMSNPYTIIIIWGTATVGYLIHWSMSGIVRTVLIQRAEFRLKDIAKRQADLVTRWGPEVTGDLVLDPHGFPLETPEITGDPEIKE